VKAREAPTLQEVGDGLIRLAKWTFLAVSVGWGAYSLWGVWTMSQMFRSVQAERTPPLTNFLSGLQLFAVTTGPLLLAIGFLLIRWPRGRRISD